MVDQILNQIADWNDYPIFHTMQSPTFCDILQKTSKLVKFRLFNLFYYPPMIRIEGCHEVQEIIYDGYPKIILNDFLLSVQRSSWSMNLKFNQYYFNIYGYYETLTHIVFCSYPDKTSLSKSYKNDPENTVFKINQCYQLSQIGLNNLLRKIK